MRIVSAGRMGRMTGYSADGPPRPASGFPQAYNTHDVTRVFESASRLTLLEFLTFIHSQRRASAQFSAPSCCMHSRTILVHPLLLRRYANKVEYNADAIIT